MVRLLLDSRPERFPRVGDRPAGAEMGEDLATLVLSLATGDLGCSVRRGVDDETLDGLRIARSMGVAALRTKLAGLTKSWPGVPDLARLAKKRGSTFSKSSVSSSSALRLPAGVAGEAAGLD